MRVSFLTDSHTCSGSVSSLYSYSDSVSAYTSSGWITIVYFLKSAFSPQDRVSLCSLGYPGTLSVDQTASHS